MHYLTSNYSDKKKCKAIFAIFFAIVIQIEIFPKICLNAI